MCEWVGVWVCGCGGEGAVWDFWLSKRCLLQVFKQLGPAHVARERKGVLFDGRREVAQLMHVQPQAMQHVSVCTEECTVAHELPQAAQSRTDAFEPQHEQEDGVVAGQPFLADHRLNKWRERHVQPKRVKHVNAVDCLASGSVRPAGETGRHPIRFSVAPTGQGIERLCRVRCGLEQTLQAIGTFTLVESRTCRSEPCVRSRRTNWTNGRGVGRLVANACAQSCVKPVDELVEEGGVRT